MAGFVVFSIVFAFQLLSALCRTAVVFFRVRWLHVHTYTNHETICSRAQPKNSESTPQLKLVLVCSTIRCTPESTPQLKAGVRVLHHSMHTSTRKPGGASSYKGAVLESKEHVAPCATPREFFILRTKYQGGGSQSTREVQLVGWKPAR